jgi:NAD(P)-dependent dehydrogenase (short-subunit alcohol dehydrogenase family)
MSSNGLLVVGSGPGIGVSTASLFAQKKFDKIALISRDKSRLSQDRDTILQSVKATDRKVEVETWSVDITDTAAFKAVLEETEKFANFSCVLFNAARVEPSELLTFPEEEIVRDFKVQSPPSNLLLC